MARGATTATSWSRAHRKPHDHLGHAHERYPLNLGTARPRRMRAEEEATDRAQERHQRRRRHHMGSGVDRRAPASVSVCAV
eukprot:scaffold38381_cov46-Tisochrysis_lutea.AAC.1